MIAGGILSDWDAERQLGVMAHQERYSGERQDRDAGGERLVRTPRPGECDFA